MAYKNLRQFIDTLQQKGELLKVSEFVSPKLQISEITDRFSKSKGKALLFENNGTAFPVLINAMGSENRICTALGVNSLDEFAEQIDKLVASISTPRQTLISKLALLPALAEVAAFMPRHSAAKGKCQEVVMNDPDLSKLPVLTCWPYDGGPFITLPLVHTRHPETGTRNLGMYRMQVMGKAETGMHWHLHKNSAAHYREYKRLGLKMPVAVALGGDPVYTYCATAPLPENIDEYLLAGFLRKKKVELVKCLTCDIEVPADADFIIEGYVDPAEELVWEGPFGDHTGFYSLADFYPKFHITCITHRSDAVYPATIVGIPPQEDKWLGKATERIFLPLIRLSSLPEIVDMSMPDEGVFHNIVLVSIRKTYPGQALKVMSSLWGAGQMMFNKILIVVDEGIHLENPLEVAKAVAANAHPVNDVIFSRGPVDVLDHSSTRFALGSKIGIDATVKIAGESKADFSFEVKNFRKISQSIDLLINTSLVDLGLPALIIGIDKSRESAGQIHEKLLKHLLPFDLHYLIYVDTEAATLPVSVIAWLVANNIDPLRDCFYSGDASGKPKLPLAIDGTRKSNQVDGFERLWPNVLTMDDETIRWVDENWNKLALGAFIVSPSLLYKPLVKNNGAVVI